MNPFFSIIVPVYNVEDYLHRCIHGVLNQTYDNYELILVDDGSRDRSGFICDEYREDKRIKVIHKENGGLSSARNAGLDIAKGQFVFFIDSDDCWINDKALSIIKEKINTERNDVIHFGWRGITFDGKLIRESNKINQDIFQSIEDNNSRYSFAASFGLFPGAAWTLCIKRSIIENNNFRFPVGSNAEDIVWINDILSHCQSFGIENSIIYLYHKGREGQITAKASIKGCQGMIVAIDKWLRNPDMANFQSISNRLCTIYQILLLQYSGINQSERKLIKKEIKSLKRILLKGKIDSKLIFILITILGPYQYGKLMSSYPVRRFRKYLKFKRSLRKS